MQKTWAKLHCCQPGSVDLIISDIIPHRNHVTVLIKNNFPYRNRLAQAAHFFDWSKVWPQVHRILRHGGTAAFWVHLISMPLESNFPQILIFFFKVYTEIRLSNHPTLTPLIRAYTQGSDVHTSLGPHYQRPGRTLLDRHLIDIHRS